MLARPWGSFYSRGEAQEREDGMGGHGHGAADMGSCAWCMSGVRDGMGGTGEGAGGSAASWRVRESSAPSRARAGRAGSVQSSERTEAARQKTLVCQGQGTWHAHAHGVTARLRWGYVE